MSLKDDSEERLRRLAQQTKGGKKGALSETVEEALYLLDKKLMQKKSLANLKKLVDMDRSFGVGKFEREEAYR